MGKMQNSNIVKEQYATSKNLNTRISIHTKYSVNKQGFGNWIFEQYAFSEGMKVLELGCGNGDMWVENYKKLPQTTELILSDFSEGMVVEAKTKIPVTSNISYRQVDIQQIPYEDKSIDIVIANMMLYHVPDLHKALKEVCRVLKDNGIFYCATYGEKGIAEYVQEVLSPSCMKQEMNKIFTLQNGKDILRNYFNNVEQRIYEDALEVTDTNDLIDYIGSLTSMIDINNISRNEIYHLLEARKVNGVIHIPKEYGMFISQKCNE